MASGLRQRAVRLSDEQWAKVVRIAKERGITASEVVRRLIERLEG